jgi:hypothetical protein
MELVFQAYRETVERSKRLLFGIQSIKTFGVFNSSSKEDFMEAVRLYALSISPITTSRLKIRCIPTDEQ